MAAARIVLASFVALPALALPAAPATGNGLYGVVRKGPVVPVCRVGEPCDAPAQVTLRFTRTTATGPARVYAVRSKATGAYRIALPPGYYTVTTKERIGVRPNIKPSHVHVRRGHWDRLSFSIDTGIR